MEDWYRKAVEHQFGEFCTPVREDGEGPVLVCLHGFPTSSWDFEPLWPTLTREFRAIAFDFLGLGKASKPSCALPIALQADLVEDLLKARGVKEAFLLAHDLGDTVAQELLARQAEGSAAVVWKAVVLLNGGIFPETHKARLIQKLLISPLGGWVAKLSSERTFRSNMVHIFGPHTPPSETFLRHSWELLIADNGRAALPRLIRYMEERKVYRDRWVHPLVQRIVPVRLINGNLDPVSGLHAANRYNELVRDADIVHLPELGHYPHVESPEAVLKPVLDFFARDTV